MEKIHNKHLLVGSYIPTKLFTSCYIIIFFFYVHHLSVHVAAGDSQRVYTPTEAIFLYCGSSDNINDSDAKNWTGDNSSKYFSLQESQNNASTRADSPQQPEGARIPYMTARVSRSQFTYTFNLTGGQKFIRFYFYASSYPGFDKSKAFFSVKAGSYTLLSNFSVFLTAEDSGKDTVFKEYCVHVEEAQDLNITFTPSQDPKDSYAFVNGIEIVSMPLDHYYTSASGDTDFPFVGQMANIYSLSHRNVLEAVYRINVGGNYISSGKDTGMYRTWLKDNDYFVTRDNPAGALPINLTIAPRFIKIQNYSAPVDVYQTARTMGQNATENQNYRLTWEFAVDPAFTYLVRLHFCEFQFEITEIGNRVFEIYIANQIAEKRADVIGWSGGNGVPVYRDYAVMMGSNGNPKQQVKLSIALHPAPQWMTNYSDAILNGVEIFKIDNSGSLAGPNPDPPTTPNTVAPPGSKPSNNRKPIIAVVAGVVSSFVAVSILLLIIFRLGNKRVKEYSGTDSVEKSWWSPFSFSTTKSTKSTGSSLPSDLCTHFSLTEIRAATNNFDKVFIIGVGGFGNVYKGYINGGTNPVAIKRLNPGSQQGALEFKTEIEMLSQLRYLHLVSLIGYCDDAGEMILVYDYMSRGTLRDHLYHSDNPPLSWNQRLEICIGAARGLHYLHTGAKYMIIHRDVKTTNILLDDKWVAKVSDFGLSKVGSTSASKAHVSTVVKGSFGYLDPEYYRLQRLTEKSDVYSFGVVLCEVVCARPPIVRTADKKQGSLAVWANQCYNQNGTLYQIVDPFLKEKIAPECMKKFSEVAMSCLHDEGTKRPSMSDVVWGLEFALQLQEEYDKLVGGGGGGAGGGDCEPHINGDGDDDDAEKRLTKNYGSDFDSGAVFSRIGGHVFESRTISTMTISTTDDYGFSSKDSDSNPMLL